MSKQLVARGQATIHIQQDGYTLTQSLGEYVFPADPSGKVLSAVTLVSTLKVSMGDTNFTGFTIGGISKPAGFSAITVDNGKKTVTYTVAAGTTTLADHGTLQIPVIIAGISHTLSFSWSKAKSGAPGKAGVDANMLDWVKEWNTGKTLIGGSTVITPKLFAGVKNADGTLTGMAIGRFALQTRNSSGTVITETVNGIYGFKDGYKTFFVDNGGSVHLGYGDQYVKYNAATGRVEFGAGVSLNWTNAIAQAKTEAVNTASATAQAKADAAKNAAIAAAATATEVKIRELEVGGDNLLPNGDFRNYTERENIGWDNALNGTHVPTHWGSGYNSGVASPSVGYHAHMDTTVFGFPVLELINRNSEFGQTRRWLGIAAPVYDKARMMPGSKYTFSADLMVDTTGMTIHGGVYSTKKGKTSANFSSGSYSLAPAAMNRWQRVSYTFTLDAEIDLSKPVSFYIYGYNGAEGTAWVKNVSLQAGTKGSWTRCQADVENEVADAKKAGTDARAVADAITTKAGNEGWSTKLTYIDRSGIFTGTLSANTVNALRINASQITSGTIAAARIDVAALKASLITAGNIEALTLNVTKGKIGGWTVDGDSIYRGAKNNASGAYTAASGGITVGSNGIRGYKWRLDGTGAGAVAGGNISWDAAGNVTFGTSVSVVWSAPIGSITAALGGDKYPKLTRITAEGIYTGSVTASQITAGTLSADRIAAGSISAAKLDAASIKSSIINTDYINGLSCTFTKGKIGGWTIGTSALTGTHISIDSNSKRIAVYGANSGIASGQRVQLYYSSDTDFGLYATNSAGACVARLGSSNSIAGWTIDKVSIRKGNVSLGSDGSITNAAKWKLNNDGSGRIASGNIAWDTAGNVTFGASVSLQWKNDIEAAKTANFGYRYYKKIVINGDDTTYYPVIFKGGEQTVKRDILVRRGYSEQAPDTWNTTTHKGGLILLLKANFGGWGGIGYSWDIYELSEMYCRIFGGAVLCGNCCMFAVFLRGGGTTGAVYHIYSDQPVESSAMSPSPIPPAPQVAYNSDLIFQSGSSKANAPAPRTLTASVEEEIRRHRFIALAQNSDSTLSAHPLTYIGSTGIYTGTLTAAQVNAVSINASSVKTGTLSADRIAAGSISASKLDAASIRSDIINTAYINGLSCTFTKGKIGGFSIGSDNMTVGSIGAMGTTPLQFRSVSTGSGYWYTGDYKPFGVTLTWHRDGNAGHIVFGQVAASGCAVKSGFIGIQMMTWDHQEYFCLSANYTKSGGKEIYNRIAGWAFDHNHIWKNNISLGADGSITNGARWKLNNDGSGQIAGGNISWNASGSVTFASSVSAQWTTGITTAQELASAMAFGKMLYRDPTFWNGNNSVAVYNNSANGMVTVTRQQDATAPNDSKYVLKIQTSGTASPSNGGFYFGTMCSCRKVLVARIIAKIPAGRSLCWATNSIGTGGSGRWLTSTAGTGDWKEYVYKVVCGTANFSSTHFFYVDGTQGTSSAPVVWYVAYATVFDLTSTERYTTTIDANGIYTGTVRAGQVIVDSTLVVGGSSYNGSISVRDASNNVKVTLDRTGITAVAGKIGGWVLGTSSLTASAPSSGHRIVMGASGYIYHDNPSTGNNYWALNTDGSATFGCGKISFANDGSGFLANRNIQWDVSGNVTMTGTINANSGTIGGFIIGQGRIGSTATGTGTGGGLAIYDDLFRVGNTTSYVLFGGNTIPATAGGSCATGRIVNNKVNSYFNNNYGLYIDVKNATRNYGIWSNAALIGPACIGNKIKNIYFTGSGYTIDFSQFNIFFVYANSTYNVNLPSASSVATMFGYSSLPSDFACVFTLVYNYNWGGHINIMNVRNQNGGTTNYGMEKGDSLTLLCSNYPSFHYQILNYYS